MSRSWRGGAVLPPARQDQAHRGTVQRLAPFTVGSFSPRGFRPADGAGSRHFGAGICAPTSRTSPSTSVWPWFLCCLPSNGSLGVAVACSRGSTPWRIPHTLRHPTNPVFRPCFGYLPARFVRYAQLTIRVARWLVARVYGNGSLADNDSLVPLPQAAGCL